MKREWLELGDKGNSFQLEFYFDLQHCHEGQSNYDTSKRKFIVLDGFLCRDIAELSKVSRSTLLWLEILVSRS